MHYRLFRVLLSGVLLIFSSTAFSQFVRGTYKLRQNVPKELKTIEKTDSIYEFPVFIGNTILQLKGNHKAKWIQNKGYDNEETREATWTRSNNTVELLIVDNGKTFKRTFEIVDFERERYLKSLDTINLFYRKE